MTPRIPPPIPHLRTYRTQESTVLEFHGEIDIAAALEIAPRLDRATGPRASLVVIDLTPTTFIDCSGLRLLCRARARVVGKRGQLLLVCPHPRTLALLRLVQICDVFNPYPTVGAALAAALPAQRRTKKGFTWADGRLDRTRSGAHVPS
ncbi:STAS domain-containing protein [Streptomyces sp. AN091965]|uniref:STAS domain-containing protein n=1 Tax=Streptomyces sp. AN091965 TaxID=2927803 RepID=UPI0027E46574|nr:STAS domain-containing protein [Streptomyces sp. AN091965]